jgi:hypothetical protein
MGKKPGTTKENRTGPKTNHERIWRKTKQDGWQQGSKTKNEQAHPRGASKVD